MYTENSSEGAITNEKGEALISQVRRAAPNEPAPKVIEAIFRALIEQEDRANLLLGEIRYSPLPSLSELMRAPIYIALDRKDDALATLEKAYEMRLVALPFTILRPAHAPLRSDPRHQDLLRCIGLRPRTAWSQSNQAAELPDVVALRTH